MDEFLATLTELFGDDHPLVVTLSARVDGEEPWADASTDELEDALDHLRSLADRDDVSPDDLEAAVDAATEIRATVDARHTAEAEAAEAKAAKADELRALTEVEETEEEADAEEAESGDEIVAEDETEEPEAVEPEAEVESTDETAETEEVEPEREKEPVAASTTPQPRRPRTPARHRPNPIDQPSDGPLVAAASLGRFNPASRFQSENDVGEAFNEAVRALGQGGRQHVVRGSKAYPDERKLSEDSTAATAQMRKAQAAAQERARDLIDRALWSGNPYSPEMKALVADGGVCGPAAPRYDFFDYGSTDRPIRDALPSFDASRGRVTWTPTSLLTDVSGGITTLTEDQDAAGNTNKNVVSVDCPTNTTVELQAHSSILEVGNWQQQFHPERTASLVDLLAVQTARVAEDALWDSIVADGTAVEDAEELSATRDILEALGRYVSIFRDRHRLDDGTVFRMLAPRGLRELMRGDLARQMPGDNTYAVTDAMFAQWFAVRNVLPTWTKEASDTFEFLDTQGVGPVQGWSATVDIQLFPEGTHSFLDGGALNLGVVRDSTLNASNNVQFFSEIWEETARFGIESWDITLTICPSGMSAGSHNAQSAFDPCPPGS